MSSTENYLRAIYRLTKEGDEGATTSELAGHLDVSNASASEAIQKLEEENLVCRAPYKGFTLSPMGKEEARKLTEKYDRLLEIFRKTGVEDAEKEADKAEHALSIDTVEKLGKSIKK